MKINKESCPFSLSGKFVGILEEAAATAGVLPGSGVIINFRDPDYSAETGGFHPVEVMVAGDGRILYVTDFAYVGHPAELAKEIDFDFGLGLFQHFGREYPLAKGKGLFALWQKNFCAYHQMGTYQVTVEAQP
jgi:hypothetical protein